MRRTRTKIGALAVITAALVFLSPTSSLGDANNLAERLDQLRTQQQQEFDQEDYWRSRHWQLLSRKTAAEAVLERAKKDYTRARRLRRRRGGSTEEAESVVKQFEAKLSEADAKLEAFYEEARRADVPSWWLRNDQ